MVWRDAEEHGHKALKRLDPIILEELSLNLSTFGIRSVDKFKEQKMETMIDYIREVETSQQGMPDKYSPFVAVERE